MEATLIETIKELQKMTACHCQSLRVIFYNKKSWNKEGIHDNSLVLYLHLYEWQIYSMFHSLIITNQDSL